MKGLSYEKFIFVLSFFILTGLLSAQQTTGSQSMFSASYNYEKNGDYKNAISSILKVYDKDNYFINLRLGWLYYLSADYNSSKKYYESAKKYLWLLLRCTTWFDATTFDAK